MFGMFRRSRGQTIADLRPGETAFASPVDAVLVNGQLKLPSQARIDHRYGGMMGLKVHRDKNGNLVTHLSPKYHFPAGFRLNSSLPFSNLESVVRHTGKPLK